MGRKAISIALSIVGAGVSLLLLIFLFRDDLILAGFYYYFEDHFVSDTGMNRWLAKAVAFALILPLIWAVRWSFSFDAPQQQKARTVLSVTLSAFFLLLFVLTANVMFDPKTGTAVKYYADTPEGRRFFDHPGFDPKYGIRLKKVTPNIAIETERLRREMRPNRVNIANPDEFPWFDSITGAPKVWSERDGSGTIQFYDAAGSSPSTGGTLQPITKDVIQEFSQQLTRQSQAAAKTSAEERRKTYVNDESSGKAAVIFVNESGKIDFSTAASVCGALRGHDVSGVTNLLQQRFVEDKLFDQLLQGKVGLIQDLELSHHCEYLVLGRITLSEHTNTELPGVLTVRERIEVTLLDTRRLTIADRFSVVVNGAGFTKDTARAKAASQLTSELAAKIKISLEKLP